MKRYSFIYSYKNKKLSELIEYLEEKYGLEYLETIDFSSPLSFNALVVGFSPPHKEIMFKSNETFNKMRKCKECNFPIESSDIIKEENVPYPICRNCRRDLS